MRDCERLFHNDADGHLRIFLGLKPIAEVGDPPCDEYDGNGCGEAPPDRKQEVCKQAEHHEDHPKDFAFHEQIVRGDGSDEEVQRSAQFVVSSPCRYSDARVAPLFQQSMNVKLFSPTIGLFLLWSTAAFGQPPVTQATAQAAPQYSVQGSTPASPQGGPVSYASVTQLNGLLEQLDATSKTTQVDLAKLRIERWKTDASTKKQTLGDVDSIQRNLQSALPEMIAQLRNSPEDMPATFKLYRNLDALYDVMSGVVESVGAFGPKDDFQSLSNDLNGFEGTRKQMADRMNNLAASKEQEIVRLRADLKTAQAAIPAAPPKKLVVDDNEPAKKPVAKKKPVPKKPATTAPGTTTPAQAAPAQPKSQ